MITNGSSYSVGSADGLLDDDDELLLLEDEDDDELDDELDVR